MTNHNKCVLVALCSSLSAPENGEVMTNDTTATYTCNTGFELVGDVETTCIMDGSGNYASLIQAAPTIAPTVTCRRKFKSNILLCYNFFLNCSLVFQSKFTIKWRGNIDW